MTSVPAFGPRGRRVAIAIAVVVLLLIALSSGTGVYVNWLWYSDVGYGNVMSTMLWTRVLLFFLFGTAVAAVVFANLLIAYRLRPDYRPMSTDQQSLERYRLAITPRFVWMSAAVSVLIGLIAGISAQAKWRIWLLFWNSQPFGVKDPQFGKDISFYVFEYPFWRYLLSVAFTALVLAMIAAVVVHYLYGNIRLQGRGERLTTPVIVHLSVLFGLFVTLKAVAYYLDRFGLLTGHSGNTGLDGAAAVDVEWLIPAKNILLWIAALCAVLLFVNVGIRKVLLPGMALVLLLIAAVVVGGAVPALANQFSIKPNANEREAKYIERNIKSTRAAYGVNDIKRTTYDAKTTATQEEIRNDQGTIPNARLLDPSLVSDSFVQLQQVRSFYDFNDQLDVDRYTVDGKIRDYVVGVRELNSAQLSGNQTNWINRHTVYTHGYGFVAAPANQVDNAGAPVFVSGSLGEGGGNGDEAKRFAEATKVKQQRVYFGELISDYSIVGKDGGRDREFDRPAARGGEDGEQINTTYDGKSGVELDSLVRRTAYALHYKEKNFLLSSAINDNSKLLYVRSPRERVEKVAPFLTLDGDPYPAIVKGRVVWILDGYTTTNAYPYSQRQSLGNVAEDSSTGRGTSAQPQDQINYIRNSVKATVDAYDGTVSLYTWDTKDPVLKAWNKAFGNIVKPKSAISKELASHFRYPEDYFKAQRETIARYHVTNPQEFFNGNDFWKVPDDPTRSGTAPQPPYFLVTQFPEQAEPRFQLTSAVTAARRENLAAMITGSYNGRGEPELRVLELPGDSAIQGPNQALPKMRNEPEVRRELTQLSSGESQVVYGNLLTLPVGGGLLYIEPIYVRNTGSNAAYPLLERVLVLYGDDVAYEDTLQAALDKLFGEGTAQPSEDDNNDDQNQDDENRDDNQDDQNADSGENQSPEMRDAVADIRRALDKLRKAQQDGDFSAIGEAQEELDAATKRFEELTK